MVKCLKSILNSFVDNRNLSMNLMSNIVVVVRGGAIVVHEIICWKRVALFMLLSMVIKKNCLASNYLSTCHYLILLSRVIIWCKASPFFCFSPSRVWSSTISTENFLLPLFPTHFHTHDNFVITFVLSGHFQVTRGFGYNINYIFLKKLFSFFYIFLFILINKLRHWLCKAHVNIIVIN